VQRRSGASRAEPVQQLVLWDLRDRAWVPVDPREARGESKLAVPRRWRLVGRDRLAEDLGLGSTLLAGKAGKALGLLIIEIDARLAHAKQYRAARRASLGRLSLPGCLTISPRFAP
jgi:hypothetical protein